MEKRRPTAFVLGDREPRPAGAPEAAPRAAVVVTPQPDAFAAEAEAALGPKPVQAALAPRRGWRVLDVLLAALGGLVSLLLTAWLIDTVTELITSNRVVGTIALVLLGIAGAALLVLLVREGLALRRLANADELRAAGLAARLTKDVAAAAKVAARLAEHYRADAGTAAGRANLQRLAAEIIDGLDRLTLAERELLLAKDAAARAAIASAAQRVAVVTAISPRALVDVLFVLAQSTMMVRRIAEIYGGRPGGLGAWRLARRVLSHLAITGGVAMTDSVLSTVMGHGLAARLSAKLGEGVLNGLLTARVGLSAMAVCRPLPFAEGAEPTLQEVAGSLLKGEIGPEKSAG
jgi:putative membrane protein